MLARLPLFVSSKPGFSSTFHFFVTPFFFLHYHYTVFLLSLSSTFILLKSPFHFTESTRLAYTFNSFTEQNKKRETKQRKNLKKRGKFAFFFHLPFWFFFTKFLILNNLQFVMRRS